MTQNEKEQNMTQNESNHSLIKENEIRMEDRRDDQKDPFEVYFQEKDTTRMSKQQQVPQVEEQIENMRFISKRTFDEVPSRNQPNKNQQQLFFEPQKSSSLNYGGQQKYQETFEISFELKEKLEHLEMINRYIESKFSNRTPEVNFFLDDSNEEEITLQNGGGQINRMEDKIKEMLRNNQGPFNGTCLRDTWSKGKVFFYLNKGDYLKIHDITENGKYAHCEFEGQIGLLHINDIRVYGHVFNNGQDALTTINLQQQS